LEKPAALHLLEAAGLREARPIVAFDMIERAEIVKTKGRSEPEVTVEYVSAKVTGRSSVQSIVL